MSEPKRGASSRHSLQPSRIEEGVQLRHTQSQNYGVNKKKKVAVQEAVTRQPPATFEVVNEEIRKKSKSSRRSSSSREGVENVAFELEENVGKMSRGGNSATSSVRSSLRTPSIHSAVVREQYCCYARWSPCERALFAAVCVLAFIVLILIVVVVMVAVSSKKSDQEESSLGDPILSIFDKGLKM